VAAEGASRSDAEGDDMNMAASWGCPRRAPQGASILSVLSVLASGRFHPASILSIPRVARLCGVPHIQYPRVHMHTATVPMYTVHYMYGVPHSVYREPMYKYHVYCTPCIWVHHVYRVSQRASLA
jgi:hypothetical protein